MEIAFWWRRVRVKHLKRTVLRQLIVARKAVGVIKARRRRRRKGGGRGRQLHKTETNRKRASLSHLPCTTLQQCARPQDVKGMP